MEYNIQHFILAAIFVVCTAYIGYIPEQGDFYHIIIPYTVLFGCYITLLYQKVSFRLLLFIAIVARMILIFAFPNLSDDIYRFIWDGRLIHMGISPYAYLPNELVGTSSLLTSELFNELNSPKYYSLYPPIAQLFNYISTILPSQSFWLEAIVYKSLLLSSDLILLRVLYLLFKMIEIPLNHMFIYALNPLIIIEINGNVHFEGVMILFLAISLYNIKRRKATYAGAALGLSVASKMLPLMYSLSIFCFSQTKERKFLVSGAIISSVVLFLPALMEFGQASSNILTSLDLYVKKFEFNGSIYYVLRFIGYRIYGFNTIHIWGPFLSFFALASILFISVKTKFNDYSSLMDTILWITIIFLITSRTVHPWYLSLAIFSCMFTRFRFPIVWSYLIFFSYINYSYQANQENLTIVFIEYATLIFTMLYELKLKKPRVDDSRL